MTSKYFIDNSDLSSIINLNPSSNANVNYIFLGVDLSNNALDSVTSVRDGGWSSTERIYNSQAISC